MSASQDDIAALEKLEERRYAAMLAGDADALVPLLHDELVYMHSTGGADSKDSYLTGLREGTFKYREIAASDRTIRVHNDIGMVFHHMDAKVEIRGKDVHLVNRMLSVWSRDGGRWRLIALQSGAIPPQVP